jgi:acetylglutamate kinase
MTQLTIVKVGGKIVEEPESLEQLLNDFAAIKGNKLLVHGGGRSATKVAAQLGIETKMVDGRRVTDAEMLKVVTMVYGGLVNKNIVAKLQARGINALGLTGADMNVIQSHKRSPEPVDFGFVGDVDKVDGKRLSMLVDAGVVPIMAPLTHNKEGELLNTNADTIAGEVAKAMTAYYDVTLMFCFEKDGVLANENDDSSVIPHISGIDFQRLVDDKVITGGMIPKIKNAVDAVKAGVKSVIITKATAIDGLHGTKITKE